MWEPFFIIISLMILLALNVVCMMFPFYIRSLNRPAEQGRRLKMTLLLSGIVLAVLLADWAVVRGIWVLSHIDS